ncbi:DUF3137 domain-containing protein [Dysgonomonas sp. 216]|uniref:DUF3137 domain-containing protein n=1 Tax=Dysgonomonas sp. 216 TaxID=2302934 RepID=UPI0013D52A7C|nr:DUF3137 domain-containing protein [Dysgonomonas sp. 216]NDW18592.1 DUF3137 domain-containing protein [Dysgonomonas sp. 216]
MKKSLLNDVDQQVAKILVDLKDILEPLEVKRLETKKRLRIFWIATFASFLILAAFVFFAYPSLLWGYLALCIIFPVLYFFWVNPLKTTMENDFNTEVAPLITSEFLVRSKFNMSGYINTDEYYNSDLYRTLADKYSGSNFISGIMGDTFLQFSKLHSQYKTETRDKNGNRKTTWHTIFEGVFLIADSNKHFAGETFILPDTAERMFGGIGRWIQEKFGTKQRGELVYMEDPVFEKKFVVYATDPVEARYLLTPTMQQCFVDLVNTFGDKRVRSSFIDGKLYIAISGNFDLFAFKMNKSMVQEDTIRYYVNNLIHILSVVEILDLNTRIWGK